VNRLVTGEKLLQAEITDVLREMGESAIILTRGIESRTDYLAQEIDWFSVLQAKTLQILYSGKILSANLEQLLHGIRELNNGRLSQDIVSTI